MRIRPYRKKDFDIISQWIRDERTQALWCADLITYPLVKEKFDEMLQLLEEEYGDSPFVATTDEGKVIGFFCFSINLNTNEGMFKVVVIDDTMRNQGYGCEMLSLAVKYAFEIAKTDAVHLNVFSSNSGAKRCYQKVGFRDRAVTENAFKFKDELWAKCNMVISK